nr:MAG: hypothetical protein DIU70_08650 [Bacillota bacterium]
MARILVVDGSILDRKRAAAILQAAGHTVVEAASAAEARRLLGRPGQHFHLLVTELHLPDMDGLEFIRAVKADPAGASLPILVVTPLQAREVVIQTILAGAEHMVAKPYAGETLLRRATEILTSCSLAREEGEARITWSLAEVLRRETKRAVRTGQPLSVLVLRGPAGIGRQVAEAVLRRVQLRETDLVIPIDDGVAILLPDTDAAGAQAVAERLRRGAAEAPPALPGQEGTAGPPGLAMGIATLPEDGRDAEALLWLAVRRARPMVAPEGRG